MSRVQDPTTLVLLDGKRLDAAAAAVPAAWPALLRGEGIFETFLVRDGRPTPLLAAHDRRLAHSARLTGFDLAEGELLAAYEEVDAVLPPGCWRVRLSILRGIDGAHHRLWTVGPEPPPQEEVAIQLSGFRIDPADPLAGAKTISRMGWQVARRRAAEAGAFEAILCTVDGHLAEGTSSNLFWWIGGRLRTPSLDCGILGGVTRGAILAACQKAGIPLEEGRFGPGSLEEAEEVFLSNAVIGFVPTTRIVGVREDLPGRHGTALPRLRDAHRSALASLDGSFRCQENRP
jgi:4-amino-4-deoxychorismate lyase